MPLEHADKTVYIVDDHPVVRVALSGVITSIDTLSVVGTAGSVEEAFIGISQHKPDLIITDFNLGGDDGYDFLYQLKQRYPKTPVLLFTVADECKVGPRAFREGVSGVVTKDAPIQDLKTSILSTLEGKRWASERLTQTILSQGADVQSEEVLTRRELQVYVSIGKGLTTKEISTELGISVKTVENHRENIKSKLRISTAVKLQTAARDYYIKITQNT